MKVCPFRTCLIFIDPQTGRIISAFGPVLCPCDWLPGRFSSFYDGLPKPGAAMLIRGRHGSRIARSKRRHTPPARVRDTQRILEEL